MATMKMSIKLSTGKEIELTQEEFNEIIFLANKNTFISEPFIYPVIRPFDYPQIGYPIVTCKTTCEVPNKY